MVFSGLIRRFAIKSQPRDSEVEDSHPTLQEGIINNPDDDSFNSPIGSSLSLSIGVIKPSTTKFHYCSSPSFYSRSASPDSVYGNLRPAPLPFGSKAKHLSPLRCPGGTYIGQTLSNPTQGPFAFSTSGADVFVTPPPTPPPDNPTTAPQIATSLPTMNSSNDYFDAAGFTYSSYASTLSVNDPSQYIPEDSSSETIGEEEERDDEAMNTRQNFEKTLLGDLDFPPATQYHFVDQWLEVRHS